MTGAVYSLLFLIFYIWYVGCLLVAFHKNDTERLLNKQKEKAEEVLQKIAEELKKQK